ncbi:hypothetical protein C8J56DRAFT_1057167 [Mycena floridula]|nr:hypothetical protein C8J56DRAFT_1057167 [Mycena floridula]
MTVYEVTHLQLLDKATMEHGSRPMFWIPIPNGETPPTEWSIVTYAQFHAQVLSARGHYTSKFSELEFPPGSVIGVWLSGNKYTDLVHNLGISAAGYIPQLFSVYWSHSQLVFNMLLTSGAKALVLDSTVAEDIQGCPVPTIDISTIGIAALPETSGKRLHNGHSSFEAVKNDVVFMMHTSGSTSGVPKIIPWTNRWISSIFTKFGSLGPSIYETRDVFVRVGNYHHAATLIGYLGHSLFLGISIVMPSTLLFGAQEMMNMIKFCGLNKLTQFGTVLEKTLQVGQKDPEVLAALQGFREILHTGTFLTPEMKTWAVENGLKMRTTIASSEVGPMMSTSNRGCIPSHLRPWPALVCSFLEDPDSEGRLVQLVVEASSPDIPTMGLAPDGRFYTGDLYERCEDGCFIFKGRNDDWIKCGVGLVCDCRAIEDIVRRLCPDLITDCVVVGQNRQGPALLIEPAKDLDIQALPETIISRMTRFNEDRFPHERVDNPGLVLVVETGSLPRAAVKGNIRRKGAEELFREKMDAMYNSTAAAPNRMLR